MRVRTGGRLAPGSANAVLQVYKSCGSACPQTCEALSRVDEDFCTEECVEGCFCPDGTVMLDGQCVAAADCPCYQDERPYPAGSYMTRFCQDW